jgi:hypothetical protein
MRWTKFTSCMNTYPICEKINTVIVLIVLIIPDSKPHSDNFEITISGNTLPRTLTSCSTDAIYVPHIRLVQ